MLLKHYSDTLENLAKNKSTEIFSNKDNKHAAIAIEKLLKYSQEKFVIYDDDLSGDIFDDDNFEIITDTIINFLAKGGTLRIIIKHKDNKISKFGNLLHLLSEIFSEQLSVVIATDEFRDAIKKEFNGMELNFAVGDTDKYRLEIHEGKVLREAKASFNNIEYPTRILKVLNALDYKFNNYFDGSK